MAQPPGTVIGNERERCGRPSCRPAPAVYCVL